jgi:serine/threonine protein kinase
MKNLENSSLGKYDALREIGAGNTSKVYRALDPFAGRDVALKVALPEMLGDAKLGPMFRQRFFNEAKIAGMVKHPSIVAVYDAGVDDDLCYIAMEFIRGGRTLSEYCRPRCLLPIADAVQMVFKCAAALDFAHERGVVHRDVKPRNVLLTDAQDVKVADFGAAFMTSPGAGGARLQDCIGSPLYMSPEQLRHEELDGQSDIFSLGVLMYELLTGRHPFTADNLKTITQRIAAEEPPPVTTLRSNAPQILDVILRRALRKSRRQRYRRAMDLAGDLSLAFDHLTLSEADLSDDEKVCLVKDLRFFSEFSEPEIAEVVHTSVWKQYGPGDTIIVEGELDTSFFILVSGRVAVRKGDQLIGEFGGGMCFGEMGYITGERRTATVMAQSDTWVIRVSPSAIARASVGCQLSFHKVFLSTVATRLRLTTEEMTELRVRIDTHAHSPVPAPPGEPAQALGVDVT